MTRKEAKREIDNIDFYLQHHTDDYSERSHDAMMMAIQSLSQEPCDDAISREALIAKLTELIKTERSTIEIKAKLIPMIEQLPSVTQKSGKWITDEPTVLEPYVCSECGIFHNGKYKNFCPNCGAKMESEDA